MLAVKIVTEDGEEFAESFLARIAGWTEEQYFLEAPESRFVEFEDGEVIVHSPVGVRHQRVAIFLAVLLQLSVRRRGLGEVLTGPGVVRLRPGLNYEPDIFFISRPAAGRLGEHYFAGAPGFVVEVVSPGTWTHDLVSKAAAYQRHGVPEYWVVDPERKVVVRHLLAPDPRHPYQVTEHAQGRLESRAVPGFWIEVSWLWDEVLPDGMRCLEQILAA